MKKIKVRNWDRWQTYRSDRGMPPWIKLHRCLLRNIDWVTLTDEQRGQLVSIWILAADDDGKVPADPQAIKLLCHMTNEPDLNLLRDKGFIDFDANLTPTWRQPDANVTPSGCQPDANVTPHVMSEEGNVIESKNPPAPRKRGKVVGVDEVVTYLNQITGRSFALDRGNEQIERVLKAGSTVQDCRDVIDRCWRLWRDKPEMVANVNKVTPFRAAHFDAYLDEARAGSPKASRPAPKPVEDDDPDLTAAEREAARAALANLGLGGMCNWT
jgi:uncharacterized phage protein (TIGR02220 family)